MAIAEKPWNFIKCNCKPGSIGLIIDNSICFDKSLVSEHFNNYFSNVAPTLVGQLPQVMANMSDDTFLKISVGHWV